ncbi:hypothetical protein F8388_013388 [Cannabis sativa]|uniref:Uncharacterized protein n=1 Tax=Cannabis sativa TaxID=3483 RepID=A0A7J6FGS3_CANSA|nr:hypothetical protein F8388_013388 [Cannabis sativa]
MVANKMKGKLEPSERQKLIEQDVPIGGEDCAIIRKMIVSPREFSFPVKDHQKLGKELDLLDFDLALVVPLMIVNL